MILKIQVNSVNTGVIAKVMSRLSFGRWTKYFRSDSLRSLLYRGATCRMGQKGSHELRTSDISHLRDITHFNTKEISDWHIKFHSDYPSGVITKPEFIRMYCEMFPDGDARHFAEHVFRAYDMDGNGTIDFSEFMVTISVSSRGTTDEKLRWAFRMYDLDGNGSVCMEEATEIIYSIFKMRGEGTREKAVDAVEQLFMQLDKNKDHSLTEKEFVMAAKRSRAIMELLRGHK